MKVKFLGMAEEDDNLKERIDNAGNETVSSFV